MSIKSIVKSVTASFAKDKTAVTIMAAVVLALVFKLCLGATLWAAEGGYVIKAALGLSDLESSAAVLLAALVTTPGTIKAAAHWMSETVNDRIANTLAVLSQAVSIALIIVSTTFADAMIVFIPMNIVMTYFTYMLMGKD